MYRNALLLSAGFGSRLKPYSENWPKCLMPIHEIPLLEYWIRTLIELNFDNIFVNTHHHANIVKEFLSREVFKNRVNVLHEPRLLGTAGTIRANASFFCGEPLLLIHADNWCQCNLKNFIETHYQCLKRVSTDSVITMMTFWTSTPESCGIVELDKTGIVVKMHEKIQNPPSNLANGAVYMIDPEVIKWITDNPDAMDFSTQVLPFFMGRIATWENKQIHRDIGNIKMLWAAQSEGTPITKIRDEWALQYERNPIHKLISRRENHSNVV